MSRLTRRSFLEHTLWTGAAGLAAARIASAKAEPTTKPGAGGAAVSPSDKIGIAVIGLHGRGQTHVDGYTYDEGTQVVAICDVDENTFAGSQKILAGRGRPKAKEYTDIRKLLEDKDVDAVSIATPNHWHTLAALWAMQAGKDVYVEKPVSHNVSEGRRLEQARLKYGRLCQAGTQTRSNGSAQKAMEFIHSGGIGKVMLARGLCYKRRTSIGKTPDSTPPAGVDYNLWLGPAPERAFSANRFHYNWHWNWDYGNGDIGNQGIHQMDVARWALGKTLPNSVISLGGRFGYEDDGQTPNTQLALLDYGDAHLLFEVRGLPTPPLMGVTVGNLVYGSEGFVAFGSEDGGEVVAFDNQGKKMKEFRGGGNHFDNFVKAVRARKQENLNAPILEGHLSSALCHLANISYRLGEQQTFAVPPQATRDNPDLADALGRYNQHLADSMDDLKKPLKLQRMAYQLGAKLTVDAQAENFGGNAKANGMLTREYRAPFVVPETLA